MSNGSPLRQAPLVDATAGFARRGHLVVPAHLLRACGASKDDAAAVDPDGRRRVVVDGDDVKKIRRAIEILRSHGVTVLLRCDDARPKQRVGVPPPCGALLTPEGQDTVDKGFGCGCSRIHLGR